MKRRMKNKENRVRDRGRIGLIIKEKIEDVDRY